MFWTRDDEMKLVVASIWTVLVGTTVHCVCTVRRGERVHDGESERRENEGDRV